MLRNTILVTLSVFLSTATSVDAFVVLVESRMPSTQLSVSTTTHFNFDSECLLEAEYCNPSEQQQQRHNKRLSLATRSQQATWMDLPRHSDSDSTVLDLELQLGRTAMVLALGLLVTEVFTGQSWALLGP